MAVRAAWVVFCLNFPSLRSDYEYSFGLDGLPQCTEGVFINAICAVAFKQWRFQNATQGTERCNCMSDLAERRFSIGDRSKFLVADVFRYFGLSIRRLDPGVEPNNPHSEIARLLIGQPVNMIVEIGAADGRDTLRLANANAKAAVHAFEPYPQSYLLLLGKAAGHERIRTVNSAVSDRVGDAVMHVSNWADASSLLKPRSTDSSFDTHTRAVATITVKTETLDSYCSTQGITYIDLLKIDAQGAELAILHGAEGLLANKSIRLIYTEAHFLEVFEGAARFDKIMTHLADRGFKLHNIYNLAHNQRGELAWCDAIFLSS
jgi:FkbM family methyltransferase